MNPRWFAIGQNQDGSLGLAGPFTTREQADQYADCAFWSYLLCDDSDLSKLGDMLTGVGAGHGRQ